MVRNCRQAFYTPVDPRLGEEDEAGAAPAGGISRVAQVQVQ